MYHPHGHRSILRSASAFALIIVAVMLISQLAGVSSRDRREPSKLVFDGQHQQWMVKVTDHSNSSLKKATARLGGGKVGGKLQDGWVEVRLSDSVAAVDAETAFGEAGAIEVEPVLARIPYGEPTGIDTPASGGDQPSFHDDPPSALGVGSTLRNGPVNAARFAQQWSLSQASDQDIDAPEAWQRTTGSGAVVAVIDTGVDATHPDLVGRVLDGRDFSGAATAATVDRVGHGTSVASIIAGAGHEMAGVAPDANILPLKVFRDSASGFSMSGYVSAIRYAADQGVDVINISLGCGGSSACFSQAELDALTYATERGVVIVAAAGNGDSSGRGMNNDGPSTPDFPSGYELPSLLSVTSSTRFGDLSTWANYGRTKVDFAAPGEMLIVAAPGSTYRSVSGTSFSAPLASGVAALVASTSPTITGADVAARILSGVVKVSRHNKMTSTGGILNAEGALLAIGSADTMGGGASRKPLALTPKSGAIAGSPPVLSWSLPTGWSSQRVVVKGAGGTFIVPVSKSAHATSHPSAAWRSGTYRWSLISRSPSGTRVVSPARSYTMLPRLGAWVTSGRIRSNGGVLNLRVGYAASEPRAFVRIKVRSGRTILHQGKATSRTSHVHGVGSPRRGWFSYQARLKKPLRRGQVVVVEVEVRAADKTLKRTFKARVY